MRSHGLHPPNNEVIIVMHLGC